MLQWLQRLRRLTRPDRPPAEETRAATVTVLEGGRPTRWRAVPRIEEAGPDERAFAFDPDTGAITFGDGEHGRRPERGAIVRVRLPGAGAAGDLGGRPARVVEYEFRYGLFVASRTPPGEIRQVMPAGGWSLVEATPTGERLTPLVGWALLDPYVPPYREGGESYAPAERTVRGLIAPAGGPVRIVDELAEGFAGYRPA